MTFLKKHLPVTIIVIFHLVGFIGFLINPGYFRALTPFNLLLSALLLLITSAQTKWKFYAVMAGVVLAGYFVEVAGVKTGLIFGHYHYGSALGIKWLSVPLLIGLNWVLLIYATSQFFSFSNKYVNAFLAAALMMGLDFFIEQSASKFDFWYWKNARIPLQNYIAWFIISFIIHIFSNTELSKKPNITAKAFFVVQVVFFAALFIFA